MSESRVLKDILECCLFHLDLGDWDLAISIRRGGGGLKIKAKEGKSEIQGEWEIALALEISRYFAAFYFML